MAKSKKKKRRPPPPTTSTTGAEHTAPATTAARRERKEAARARREREAKAAMRRRALRRAVIGGVVGVLVFVAITWYSNRAAAPAPSPLPQTAIDAALAAGCSDLQRPDPGTPSREHLSSGTTYGYAERPATSGPHDPSPLDDQPRVYDAQAMAQYQETRAVHSLEHGSVIMYYRAPSDTGGLPQSVVNTLAPIAQTSPATYLIPYPDLPTGTALAFTAWNELLTCPAKIDAEQADAVARGFIQSLACTSNAPEPKLGYGCPT